MNFNFLFSFVLFFVVWFGCKDPSSEDINWSIYSADNAGSKYSALEQINEDNVDQLQLVWKYSSGDQSTRSTIECNPIIVDGVMYITTPALKLVALDATLGKEIWSFDAENSDGGVNRGVTYLSDGIESKIYFVKGSRLYCLDAKDGSVDSTFGADGAVDLYEGLGRNVRCRYKRRR